jgi:glycosyltransferase involved in cell wall biosynthesis
MTKTFVAVHNIPSPYRLHLFDVLGERLRANNIEFHVHFMAHLHRDRPHWAVENRTLSFSHTFWPDVGPTIRGMRWHLNPGLVKELWRQPCDYLLMGGLWDSITNMLVSGVAKRTVGIAWLEGNTKTTGRTGGLALTYKQLLLRRYQFVAVPGIEGRNYLRLLIPATDSPPYPVVLPNIVDERKFIPRWQIPTDDRYAVRSRFGVAAEDKLAVWPARLVAAKGIVEFLLAVPPQALTGWKLLLLGEGPLKEKVQDIVQSRGLEENVVLRSYVGYDEMPGIYGAADLFLLPSISDPNPLSVVEAMFAGLPILVSDRIGNYPEALHEDVNGWGFNPYQPDSVLAATCAAFSAPREQIEKMGRQSRRVAEDFWGSINAIDRFIASITVAALSTS